MGGISEARRRKQEPISDGFGSDNSRCGGSSSSRTLCSVVVAMENPLAKQIYESMPCTPNERNKCLS